VEIHHKIGESARFGTQEEGKGWGKGRGVPTGSWVVVGVLDLTVYVAVMVVISRHQIPIYS